MKAYEEQPVPFEKLSNETSRAFIFDPKANGGQGDFDDIGKIVWHGKLGSLSSTKYKNLDTKPWRSNVEASGNFGRLANNQPVCIVFVDEPFRDKNASPFKLFVYDFEGQMIGSKYAIQSL